MTTVQTTGSVETLPVPDKPVRPGGMPLSISGDWTGELRQRGLKPFKVAVRIAPQGRSPVAYTGINCGGQWAFRLAGESKPPTFVIDEGITEGAGGECEGSGTVTLRPHSKETPYTELGYQFDGDGVTSRGVLQKTDETGLQAVFSEAGVTLP